MRRSAARAEYFGDTLVSITGAGSGIGRETAIAFAREGAEVVVSDIDEATVKDTAAQIAARGGVAHAYVLDVSDADAVEAFAEQVCAEHGVPDIVVNNAGIGQAGGFLDTPAEQFDRVLDINLGGVVNGCRSFGRRLVERGTGGHIVNVASMAAYAPLQSLSAYCTSKAATYMFSDCLRAELDAAGVGLTTICPGVINTNIINTTRFDARSTAASTSTAGAASWTRCSRCVITGRTRWPTQSCRRSRRTSRSGRSRRKPMRSMAFLAVLPQALRSTARVRVI